MRIILTIMGALGLGVLAVNSFMDEHWVSGAAFLAGALAIVLPLLFGRGLGDLEDADMLVNFVRNPLDTIVEESFDRLTQDDDQTSRTKPGEVEYPKPFDADAALQRYLANKAAAASDAGSTPAPAPARTFGRKQV